MLPVGVDPERDRRCAPRGWPPAARNAAILAVGDLVRSARRREPRKIARPPPPSPLPDPPAPGPLPESPRRRWRAAGRCDRRGGDRRLGGETIFGFGATTGVGCAFLPAAPSSSLARSACLGGGGCGRRRRFADVERLQPFDRPPDPLHVRGRTGSPRQRHMHQQDAGKRLDPVWVVRSSIAMRVSPMQRTSRPNVCALTLPQRLRCFSSHCSSHLIVYSPARNSSSRTSGWWSGMVVFIPSTTNSSSARRRRMMQRSRVVP